MFKHLVGVFSAIIIAASVVGCTGEDFFVDGFDDDTGGGTGGTGQFDPSQLSNGANAGTSTEHYQDTGTGSIDFYIALYDDDNCEFLIQTDNELAMSAEIFRGTTYDCTYVANGSAGIDLTFTGAMSASDELLTLRNIVVGTDSFTVDASTGGFGPFSYDMNIFTCNIDDADFSGGCV